MESGLQRLTAIWPYIVLSLQDYCGSTILDKHGMKKQVDWQAGTPSLVEVSSGFRNLLSKNKLGFDSFNHLKESGVIQRGSQRISHQEEERCESYLNQAQDHVFFHRSHLCLQSGLSELWMSLSKWKDCSGFSWVPVAYNPSHLYTIFFETLDKILKVSLP